MSKNMIAIGGASGFWGDSVLGPMQLVASRRIDYLVFDYLAELTMSLLASARMKNPEAGYAADFIDAMRATLKDALSQGVRIISNAGGMNPRGCAHAVRALADELGVSVRIAVVEGDDVMPLLPDLRADGLALPVKLVSANAYLGALPIKQALDAGADVVITGRCVDSAVTLGALMHEFGWGAFDFDLLAAGSLAGHLLECGCQGVGGLHTDWQSVPDWAHSGYPIAECHADGRVVITKPAGTGGLVTPATVGEQLLYEIGDPRAYLLPDVTCDFAQVRMTQDGPERVLVQGARGRAPGDGYKVSATYVDGFRCTAQLTIVGFEAEAKVRRTAEAILTRVRERLVSLGLGDFSATHIELLGRAESFGSHIGRAPAFEAVLMLAVRHADRRALEIFAREIAPAGTSWAPGTTGLAGRPGVTPAIKQQAFMLPKARLKPCVRIDEGEPVDVAIPEFGAAAEMPQARDLAVRPVPSLPLGERTVPLIELAYARSGDKGDSSNIGVIARRETDLPLLREQLTAEAVAAYLAHLVQGPVTRYELPGLNALNFVCERALGGGGMASLRHDALGKGMAQVLLAMPIRVPDNQ
ncbi:MAG: DUF1446 domain-containing protein [Burkholderiaceae bacterium]|nr:DUF1446 domain-containing protein [Burkholderiaceae bacterium]